MTSIINKIIAENPGITLEELKLSNLIKRYPERADEITDDMARMLHTGVDYDNYKEDEC